MKCPGQDTRYWKPGAVFEVGCPKCGNEVEFFKDDTSRSCTNCGYRFANPRMDFGCATYCKYAQQCIGGLLSQAGSKEEGLLKDRVVVEMKRYFGKDFKRIGHAANVARYAEQIVRNEGGDPSVVLCAAYLHDIGIHEAERRHHSEADQYHEEEGVPLARKILADLGADNEVTEEVCRIIGRHHHPREGDSVNFKIVYDACQIADLEEAHKKGTTTRDRLAAMIEKRMFTKAGKRLARSILPKEE
jgi:putative nucleotidyltransferase with HDIG domain